MSYRVENGKVVIVNEVKRATLKAKITRLTTDMEKAKKQADLWTKTYESKNRQITELQNILVQDTSLASTGGSCKEGNKQ